MMPHNGGTKQLFTAQLAPPGRIRQKDAFPTLIKRAKKRLTGRPDGQTVSVCTDWTQRFFVGQGFIAFATSHLGHGLKMQAHQGATISQKNSSQHHSV